MSSSPKGDELAAFARGYRAPKRGLRCWGCSIPEAALMAKHYREGMDPHVILAWLRDRRGYAPEVASKHRVRDHLLNHVGRAAAAAEVS